MFSWRRPVAVLASCLRRASCSADLARMVLRATRSATPSLFFSARRTMPMPPRPISQRTVYPEDEWNFSPDRSTAAPSEALGDLHRGPRLGGPGDGVGRESLQHQL